MTATPTTIAVVPARMASSRFPGKPLVPIDGLPMVEHVRRRAALAPAVDAVVVATCDNSIAEAVAACGGRAVMTSSAHERCTDRVEEAMRALEGDIVIVVQGDEPLLLPGVLAQVAAPLRAHEDIGCTNLLSRMSDPADFSNPDIVKAVTDRAGFVMFLSRAPIPYFRHAEACPVYRQTGIMAFRRACLERYVALPQTPFERAESIDMLRLLEHGERILGVAVDYRTIGVDRPEDVALVEARLRSDPEQRALHARVLGTAAEHAR